VRFPALLIGLGLGLGLGLGGCQNSSQIVIGVLTNMSVKGQLDEVSMIVTRNGGVAVLSEDWDISNEATLNFVLPGSFTVFSPEGGTPVVEIVVTGLQNSQEKVTRIADVELLSQDQVFFRMALVDICGATGPGATTCPDGQSCVEGLCRSTQVDNRSLRPFAKDRVAAVECDSGVGYIKTGTCSSGTCEVIAPNARSCPGTEWCGEGTCYDRDPASPRELVFGASCNASLGDGCTLSDNACVAPGTGNATGVESCRQHCTSDTDCTLELPGAVAAGVTPTTASCDPTAGVCTYACNVFSATSGCAPGARCDIAFPTPSTVGVDCVDATFGPDDSQMQPAGAACTTSRNCVPGATCLASVCRTLCQPGSNTSTCMTSDVCTPVSPPDTSNGPSEIYGTCCPDSGC
jgi:hypothetical protein